MSPCAPVVPVVLPVTSNRVEIVAANTCRGSGLEFEGLEGPLALCARRQFEATRSEPGLLLPPVCVGEDRMSLPGVAQRLQELASLSMRSTWLLISLSE